MTWCASARWNAFVMLSLGAVMLFCGQATGNILSSSDTAIAIDTNAVLVGAMNNGRYPMAEGPANAIDNNPGTKYLNFGREGSGFIVTPFAPIPVESFQIRTANDWPGRDPGSYALYGFTGSLVTTDSGPSPAINQTGLAEAWTLIASGALSLPGDPNVSGDQRGVLGPLVVVNPSVADTGYQHYKMIFPTVKNNAAPNVDSMQFAEIQFFDSEAGTGAILANGDPIIAVDETPTPPGWSGSSYPNGERPAFALDQDDCAPSPGSCTKYLNFGEEGSGLIITNSGGPTTIGVMQLETANDSTSRDPASYELYGTNDPIMSVDNSNGTGETWTSISSGPLALSLTRGDKNNWVPINSSTPYTSYKLIFPTVRTAASANSMQIGNVQFWLVPEPSALALVMLGSLSLALASRRRVG